MLWHYAYGKPKETVEMTGKDGGPLVDPLLTMSSDEQRRELARMQAEARARIEGASAGEAEGEAAVVADDGGGTAEP